MSGIRKQLERQAKLDCEFGCDPSGPKFDQHAPRCPIALEAELAEAREDLVDAEHTISVRDGQLAEAKAALSAKEREAKERKERMDKAREDHQRQVANLVARCDGFMSELAEAREKLAAREREAKGLREWGRRGWNLYGPKQAPEPGEGGTR